jgi:hypothetical protein
MISTTLLGRLGGGLAALAAAGALLVPSATAGTGTSDGPHDSWYAYAISLTSERHAGRPSSAARAKAFVPHGASPGSANAGQLHGLTADPLDRRGSTVAQPRGYGFVTDTLASGGSHPARPQGYTLTTDTLAPGGGPTDVVTNGVGFSWTDAGVGAGTAVAALVLAGGAGLLVRRRASLATQ